jgi:hypothetical protein
MFKGYSIAAGSVDITPQQPIPLAGYASLRKPTFERIADPLEANVAILRHGRTTVALITLDLMYVGAFLRDAIVTALQGRIPREAVLTSACHTHSAPPTEDSLPVLGAVTPEYRNLVAQRVSELTLRLLAGPFVPVSLEYVEGTATHSVNRRKRAFGISRSFPFLGRQVTLEPNPGGPRDDTIRLIRIRAADGQYVALCWSYACHPVGYPLLNDLTSEYPGAVRNALRSSFGTIPVIFWQGFSGNTAPLVVAQPALFRANTLPEWQQWANGLSRCVQQAAGRAGIPLQGPIAYQMRELPLPQLGLVSEKQVRLHEIRLGPRLALCGLNAEVAVEYVAIVRRLYAPAQVIPIGCVGDVYGYLPVDAMVREGGYEARGFVPRFGLRGSYVPNVEEVVVERLLRSSGARAIRGAEADGQSARRPHHAARPRARRVD